MPGVLGSRVWLMPVVFGLLALVLMGEASPQISVVNVVPEEYAADTQIQNQELLILTNVTKLEIHCDAHYPVYWEFSGNTSPMQMQVRVVRKSGPKLGNPTFSAQLKIYRVSASLTGSYLCRSVLNPNKFQKVFVFAQEKGYRGPDPILLRYGQKTEIPLGAEESTVKLPCSTWDPKTQIQLFKKSDTTGKYDLLLPKEAYTYDPKSGFEVNLTQLENPWGHYLCSPAIDQTFDRVYVTLVRKAESKFTPSLKTIEVAEGEELKLKCESKYEVTIHVDGAESDDSRAILTTEFLPDMEYPYITTLVYRNLSPADDTDIQCVTNPSSQSQRKVIHTWNYRVVGELDLKRRGINRYHSKRLNSDWYACWARSSLSPDLSFVQCSNPMECQIRGQCLDNANKCDPAITQLCSGGCALASIENQTGILQCKGDGVFQQIYQFMGASGAYVFNSMMEAPQEEKLHIEGKHVFKIGTSGEFTCKGSSFLYAGGFRWGLTTRGNTLKVLDPNSEEVVSFEETFLPTGLVEAKAVLRLDSQKLTQVNCFAPFWNSTDWESRTHQLYFQG